jgi:cellulose synthase/poly-beta-1,6-N-acetylglucosamine synthase-like glycosyltransferase
MRTSKPKISILIPCHNEEQSVESCVLSCLRQTRRADEVVVVDDGSTDNSAKILRQFGDAIKTVTILKATGNKSHAQEYGLGFITGDIVITTDADTLLDQNFVAEIEKSFENPNTTAVAGYVRSLPYNWLTLCRALDYTIGQGIHKLAQNYMDYIFVMPGAASAFRAEVFRTHVSFDHDTITEDLDFTYKLHKKSLKINYNSRAISFTQDPTTIKNYANQMRRWFGGGWQNLVKHHKIIFSRPVRALELSLIYTEGVVFSILLFLIPVLNIWFGIWLLTGYLVVAFIFGLWAAWKEKRPALILAPFPYMILIYINAYIYLEQFVKEVILQRKDLFWFKPDRVTIK